MKTKSTKVAKTTKDTKEFYSFKNYIPNKNAVPVVYKGTEYLSKAQCMALEGITRKELDAYLKGIEKPKIPAPEVEEVDKGDKEEDELPSDYFNVEDGL